MLVLFMFLRTVWFLQLSLMGLLTLSLPTSTFSTLLWLTPDDFTRQCGLPGSARVNIRLEYKSNSKLKKVMKKL